MKVFVAGATGAVGRRLVPMLVTGGHEVVALTRRAGSVDAIERMGAQAAVADALDREAVVRAIVAAEPEVIVHQLTGLAGVTDFKDFDRAFALTNRLRTEGTDHLLDGARAAGVRRVVAQSFGNWSYERRGSAVKTEADPLDPDPPATMRESLQAIRHLETAVVESDGVALRFGNLYGPGTLFAEDGALVAQIRARRLPVVGDGAGVWSFLHVDDAATATIAAMLRGAPGVYNVADDEPAPVSRWLPAVAEILGAKPPLHVPAWLGRLAAGEAGLSMSTRIRGASNARAKAELGWHPRYASWREGFRHGLAAPVAVGA